MQVSDHRLSSTATLRASESRVEVENTPGVRAQFPQMSNYRRSARACAACRQRKIRCDVLLRASHSCTNCELDGLICHVQPRRKRREVRSKTSGFQNELHGSTLDKGGSAVRLSDQALPSPAHTLEEDRGLLEPQSGSNLFMPAITNTSSLQQSLQSTANPGPSFGSDPGQRSCDSDSLRVASADECCILSWPQVENPFESDVFDDGDAHDGDNLDENSLLHILSPSAFSLEAQSSSHVLPGHGSLLPGCGSSSSSQTRSQSWPSGRPYECNDSETVVSRVPKPPSAPTMQKLLRLYSIYFNSSFPVMREKELHLLIGNEMQRCQPSNRTDDRKPSLALTYAILFVAGGFSSESDSKAEGFLSVRSMTDAFYNRAKLLYELGNEADGFNRLRICVLLSYERSYSRSNFENEHWILEGRKLLDAVGIHKIVAADSEEMRRWMPVYCCWLIRALGLVVTSKTSKQSDILILPIPHLTLAHMEGDLNVPSLLEIQTRRVLAEVFFARVALAKASIALCELLLNQCPISAASERSSGEKGAATRSLLGEIEQAELPLAAWKRTYSTLCDSTPLPTNPDIDRTALLLNQSMARLAHEYTTSILHQASISLYPIPRNMWTLALKTVSRRALLECAKTTCHIVERLVSHNLVDFMSVTGVAILIVPITIYHLCAKTTKTCDFSSLRRLGVCAHAFQSLSNRYEVTDFFHGLLGASLALAHNSITGSEDVERAYIKGLSGGGDEEEEEEEGGLCWGGPNDELPLPPPGMHSAVIRFQDVSLALGVVRTPMSA